MQVFEPGRVGAYDTVVSRNFPSILKMHCLALQCADKIKLQRLLHEVVTQYLRGHRPASETRSIRVRLLHADACTCSGATFTSTFSYAVIGKSVGSQVKAPSLSWLDEDLSFASHSNNTMVLLLQRSALYCTRLRYFMKQGVKVCYTVYPRHKQQRPVHIYICRSKHHNQCSHHKRSLLINCLDT
jgi:hypothetical protein